MKAADEAQVAGLTHHKLPDGSWLRVGSRGVILDLDLGNGVMQSVCRGLQSDEFAAQVAATGERQIRLHGRVVFLVDSVESRMMSTGFREQVTDWFRQHKQHAQVHMLIHSKLLEMALNLANLVIGAAAAKAYTNVGEWEAAGARFAPGFRRRALTVPAELRSLVPEA